ncbi:MAG TPA: maltotransferase domain-containing protein, partial [Solirubrobacteraceae bacterium]|nr:maltotransferase domain-containing protein [Solirubrobacteraceae bacterium]
MATPATRAKPRAGRNPASPRPERPPGRIQIQYPAPAVDAGEYPAKRCTGDTITVGADIFRDGHDLIRAVIRYRGPGEDDFREAEMHRVDEHLGGVRWSGRFSVDRVGRWEYTIEAWTDVFGTWRDELERKVTAGQHDLAGELSEGAALLEQAATRGGTDEDRELVEHAVRTLKDAKAPESAKHDVALGPELHAAVERTQERRDAVSLRAPLAIEVDRPRARFGSWYELFPRSWGGLQGVKRQLPRLAELGFDVVYLPPIHPIGHTNRKGANNALTAGPADPGSPWAIGDETGGHEAVHRELGTIEDVKELTAAARELDLDIALDFAIQCSADHPWLTQHPEWFHHRPDGTLKYAENPPKRYQDIYN